MLNFLNQTAPSTASQTFLPVGSPEECQAVLVVELKDSRLYALLMVLADQLDRILNSLEATRSLATHTERVRLAMDMHDTIVQALFGLGYSLDACAKMLTTQSSQVSQKLKELSASTFDILARLRTIINDLWGQENQNGTATDLTVTGLTTLLQLHVDSLARLYPMPIQFSQLILDPDTSFTATKVKAIQHAVQEALANALKHAQASNIKLEFIQQPANLIIKIVDDGQGFVRGTADAQTSHFGLLTMQQRIEELDGQFRLETAPGKGTIVTFEFLLTGEATL